jgi:sugar phosphate isomerase/epimerase
MGTITRSLAIPSLFPKTAESWEALERTVRFLESYPFTQLEFYSPPGHDRETAKLFQSAGFSSVLIGILALKDAGLSLCALDEDERGRAVSLLKNCMDRAAETESRSVMVNSGFIPGYTPGPAAKSVPAPAVLNAARDAYVRSIGEAAEYGERRGYNITLLLEPGDSKVQSFQLLGPTDLVTETAARIRKHSRRYALTMDVAHLREEGEDVMASLKQTLPYCDHVHLCNCVMNDPANPLFGDKHVDFDCPGACWDYDGFRDLFRDIRKLYGERDWTVTLEITCRAADNEAWFDGVVSRCGWLFL